MLMQQANHHKPHHLVVFHQQDGVGVADLFGVKANSFVDDVDAIGVGGIFVTAQGLDWMLTLTLGTFAWFTTLNSSSRTVAVAATSK